MKLTVNLVLFVIFIIGLALFFLAPIPTGLPWAGLAIVIFSIVGMGISKFFFK